MLIAKIRRWLILKNKLRPKDEYEKVVYIQHSKINLRELYQCKSKFVVDDIVGTIEHLKEILQVDLLVASIQPPKISFKNKPEISFYQWVASGGKIPKDPENTIKEFCSLAIALKRVYEAHTIILKSMGPEGSLPYNVNLLYLYIINIDSVIDQIYNNCQLDH